MTRFIERLPVRLRLTLASSVAMAALFGLLALFLFLEFRSSENANLNASLRVRASELVALTPRLAHPIAGSSSRPRPENDPAFAQILDQHAQVIDASPGLTHRPLLSEQEIARALRAPSFFERPERARLYALRAGSGKVAVVGISLVQSDEAVENLAKAMLIGLPLSLMLASALAYLLTGRVLGPVERMRERAALISSEDHSVRLPLPESHDEIRALGETLNRMLDRLHGGMERERRFASDASHELRTPLAVLKGELEVALLQDGTAEQWREAVLSAAEETEQIIALAEDLLVLARAQDGHLALAAEALDAGEVLRLSSERVTPALASVGRSLHVEAEAGTAVVADRARLRQMLDNLLDNAMEHGDGTITLSTRAADGFIELHVTDEGAGFPEAFLPHAFARFARADHARGRGGAGLGLAIVASLARCHGGDAGAANRPSGGADVWIRLPAPQHRLGSPTGPDVHSPAAA